MTIYYEAKNGPAHQGDQLRDEAAIRRGSDKLRDAILLALAKRERRKVVIG